MRDLSKKFGVLFFCLMVITGAIIPLFSARAGDGDTPTSTIPTPPPVFTSQDKDLAQGTVSCQKAVELSAKFGGFTALDATFSSKIQKSVLDNATNFLKTQASDVTGIKLDYKKIASTTGLLAAGNFVQSEFDKLFGNPLRSAVAGEAQKLIDSAKQEADKIIKQYLGDIAKDITSILDVTASVPVDDKGTQQELKSVNQSVNNVIAEQKRTQLIQDTRDKCNNLLKTTQETIKKALLYQLSTQTVDWVQNGQAPQFWKQPGKFLEDTGNLALDRFISRVAPQLCQPFRFAIQVQIPTVAREANPFYEQVTCSLSQVTDNIENFYSDFRQGGWLTYQEVWKPQNNYYGAYLMTMDAAAQTAAAAVQAAKDDVAQGRGFTSQKRCTEWTKFTKVDVSPMDFLAGTQMVGNDTFEPADVLAANEDGSLPDTNLRGDRSGRYWGGNDNYFWECTGAEVTSPGTVAASLSEKANATDLDYLSNTTDIENFLQTIQDSIVNKLVKSGVNGLRTLLPSWLPINP